MASKELFECLKRAEFEEKSEALIEAFEGQDGHGHGLAYLKEADRRMRGRPLLAPLASLDLGRSFLYLISYFISMAQDREQHAISLRGTLLSLGLPWLC